MFQCFYYLTLKHDVRCLADMFQLLASIEKLRSGYVTQGGLVEINKLLKLVHYFWPTLLINSLLNRKIQAY